MPHTKKSIFISYAREDGTPLAERLCEIFKQQGWEVFLDVITIPPGSSWIIEIQKAILGATHFISILTPKSATSRYFNDEWQIAYFSDIPIIPVKYIPCTVEGFLAIRQCIDFTEAHALNDRIVTLLSRIKDPEMPLEPLPSSIPHTESEQWRTKAIGEFGAHKDRRGVACIEGNLSPAEARTIIADAGNNYGFRHLLVTANGEAGSRLLGVVGLRQLLKVQFAPRLMKDAKTVTDIMDRYDQGIQKTPSAPCLYEHDTVETALNVFTTAVEKGVSTHHYFYMSAIPIVDEQQNAVGIVSFKDLLRAMYEEQTLPMPRGEIKDWMRIHKSADRPVYAAPRQQSVHDAKFKMRPLGQRDLPVIDPQTDDLLGLVPDDQLIANYETNLRVGTPKTVMTPVENLKLQTPDTPIANLLPIYVNTDYAVMYYSFAVAERDDPKNPGRFLGLVGYREIFRAVLEQG